MKLREIQWRKSQTGWYAAPMDYVELRIYRYHWDLLIGRQTYNSGNCNKPPPAKLAAESAYQKWIMGAFEDE